MREGLLPVRACVSFYSSYCCFYEYCCLCLFCCFTFYTLRIYSAAFRLISHRIFRKKKNAPRSCAVCCTDLQDLASNLTDYILLYRMVFADGLGVSKKVAVGVVAIAHRIGRVDCNLHSEHKLIIEEGTTPPDDPATTTAVVPDTAGCLC